MSANKRRSHILWLLAAIIIASQWIILRLAGVQMPHYWITICSGVGIFGAAILLSWAADVAQLDIPQSLALAALALIAVLPEYAVDAYFAWMAGKDPKYVQYAAANMTGANRLLIGLGWASVVIIYWLKTRKKAVDLEPSHSMEVSYLTLATIYSLVIPLKGTLSLIDTFVLFTIFIFYIVSASKAGMEEPELEGGPSELIGALPVLQRRLVCIAFFVIAGLAIFLAAEPFAESLLATGRSLGIEEFLLVQWLAPLASESPEFIVAILFALRLNPGASIGTLVSSTVNQWTLLIATLPLAFSISSGHVGVMKLDPRQREEFLLTATQSFFAVAVIANLQFTLFEAGLVVALFATQLMFPSPTVRYVYSGVYIVLTLLLLATNRANRQGFFDIRRLRPGGMPSATPTDGNGAMRPSQELGNGGADRPRREL
jgi:cation:H+ antiporter